MAYCLGKLFESFEPYQLTDEQITKIATLAVAEYKRRKAEQDHEPNNNL
jgi:hypothetical protein